MSRRYTREVLAHPDPDVAKTGQDYTMTGSDFSHTGTKRPAPVSKTGLSAVGRSTPAPPKWYQPVARVADRALSLSVDAFKRWKKGPEQVPFADAAKDVLVEALKASAKQAAEKYIPFAAAFNATMAISQAFAQGVEKEIRNANAKRWAKESRGADRLGLEDITPDQYEEAVHFLRTYQLDAVNSLPAIIASGATEAVAKAAEQLLGKLTSTFTQMVRNFNQQLAGYIIERYSVVQFWASAATNIAGTSQAYLIAARESARVLLTQLNHPTLAKEVADVLSQKPEEVGTALVASITRALMTAGFDQYVRTVDPQNQLRQAIVDQVRELVRRLLEPANVNLKPSDDGTLKATADEIQIPDWLYAELTGEVQEQDDREVYRRWVDRSHAFTLHVGEENRLLRLRHTAFRQQVKRFRREDWMKQQEAAMGFDQTLNREYQQARNRVESIREAIFAEFGPKVQDTDTHAELLYPIWQPPPLAVPEELY